MKNIAIGINIFDKNKRQDLCIDSLVRLSKKHLNVKLFNIQLPAGDIKTDERFETLYLEDRVASTVVEGATMYMPMVRDFFDALSEVDHCDNFVFLNSDIILNSKIVKLIDEGDWETIAMSRLAIHEIEDIDQVDIKHEHYQIAGFDVWAIKSNWWKINRDLFPDYIYAIAPWDVDYSTRMMVLSKCLFYTDQPPGCFHIIHEEKSHNDNPEHRYNMDLLFNKSKPVSDAWHTYLFDIIARRSKLDVNYCIPAKGEDKIIEDNFKNETIHTYCNAVN